MWHEMNDLDQYWARELGYETAAELEDWLQERDCFETALVE